jgi:hypothetical protein
MQKALSAPSEVYVHTSHFEVQKNLGVSVALAIFYCILFNML